MGKLHFDSSIIEFNYRASRKILIDSPLARIITGLMNVFFWFVVLFLPVRYFDIVRIYVKVYSFYLKKVLVLHLRGVC